MMERRKKRRKDGKKEEWNGGMVGMIKYK
jgi:hypothetical protein